MDDFWLRVIASFLVGGVWLMSVSVIAERFGSRSGGIIGGLPSTVFIALFFIALNQGPDFAVQATIVTPAAFIINSYFLLLLAVNSDRGYLKTMSLAGIFWLIAMGALVLFHLDSWTISLSIWLAGLTVLCWLIAKRISLRNHELPRVRFTTAQLMGRSLFAGLIIASAVIISKYAGEIVGGIFAAFPAMYLSTFTILYFAQGPKFTRATSAPLMISGGINTVVYCIAIYYLYPRFGIYTGTLMAYLISLASAYFVVRNLIAHLHAEERDSATM
ncbi:MAG TPA: DUF3147 family protein [Candidatus Saccharimonadales bacterium]|nr:DUF3147 family protein [Candidatus Saccharimonadales bacterium]